MKQKQVKSGMFVAPDNKIYLGMPEGRPVKGVIGFVKPDKALAKAVCLRSVVLPWSSDFLEVPETRNSWYGQESIRKILEIAQIKQQRAEAAEWCYNFEEDGVKKGEAFLPTLSELGDLSRNREAVDEALGLLHVNLLDRWCWSADEAEDEDFRAMLMCMDNNRVRSCFKDEDYPVRAMFEVDLKMVEFI